MFTQHGIIWSSLKCVLVVWGVFLHGLLQSKHKDTLFYNIAQSLYVTIYIDNIKVFYFESSTIDDLKVFLTKYCKLHDLGKIEWYLKIKINQADEVIIFNQTKYIKDFL